MIDWILIAICTYIIIKEIRNSINKRLYIKGEVTSDIKRASSVYINLYDYKRKDEVLPRAIVKGANFEEFRLNKKTIISIDLKEKIRYKYFKF
jgi:hypothetical protein